MKLFATILGALAVLASVPSFADSDRLDRERMQRCGGSLTLNQDDSGRLSIQLHDLDTNRCNDLRFIDASSGRELKSYTIKGTSYTLSDEHTAALQGDCRLRVEVSGRYVGTDAFVVYLTSCRARGGQGQKRTSSADKGISFQLSGNGNCKLMINDQFSNKLVEGEFCVGATGKDVVSYEFSNNGNCKRMINGRYSNVNVSDRLCTDSHGF